MTRVIVSNLAATDADGILKGLSERAGLGVAHNYAKRFADLADLLEHFPAAGTLKPRYGARIRQLVVRPYLIFYRTTDDDKVFILRILDGRRRITRRLISGQNEL